MDQIDILLTKINLVQKNLNIIRNLRTIEKYKTYKTILGPSNVYAYKVNNKLIIMFGDVHIEPIEICKTVCEKNRSTCIWIDDLLDDIFLNTPICIDFFCETTILFQLEEKTKQKVEDLLKLNLEFAKIKENEKGLKRVLIKYSECFGPFKKLCKYPKLRFHNIEIRRHVDINYSISNENDNIFTYTRNQLQRRLNYIKETVKENVAIDSYYHLYGQVSKFYGSYISNLHIYLDLWKNLFHGDMNKFAENIKQLFGWVPIYKSNEQFYTTEALMKSPLMRFNKQIKNLPNYIVESMYDSFKIVFDEIIQGGIDIVKKVYILEVKKADDAGEYLDMLLHSINILIVKFGVVIDDMYAYARLWKSILLYEDSSVMIIYAGDDHIRNYIRLLFEMKGQIVKEKFKGFMDPNTLKGNELTKIKISEIVERKDTVSNACIDTDNNWIKIMNELGVMYNDVKSCSLKEGIDIESFDL
ncbi:hypothetical protein QKU48_gp1426 [Fadolivirus algeromassiliense]|jgi:hypothetical protein|uniref:Uncharacterized protein n=1 Tax=Fadolivirus FV1/VV64 TaxID=3070911 RepID=A0A7D3QW65_9VIRU|nr:hypothetical protein QKU48_gp1426 [Fadolivirus algeromassiliense]QKF94884.1 hypothetical protein Fadolivirus_1_1426 [Fadolivirus FV1/VV64]